MSNGMIKLIWGSAVLAISLLAPSMAVFASSGGGGGVDVGNGGNGIQDAGGRVSIDDLAEVSIDPDVSVQQNLGSHAFTQNYTLQRQIRRLLKAKLESGDYHLDERVVTVLATQLGILSYRYPTFVTKLLENISKMQWEHTPSLLPNNDAKLRLVLTPGQQEIGCGQNKIGRVLLSQVCEKNMSPGNFAALIVHEAMYSYLASKDSRIAEKLDDSTPARRIVVEVFRAKPDEVSNPQLRSDNFQSRIMSITLPGDQEIIGLKELFSDDASIANAFFPGNRSFISSYNCSFQNTDPLFLLKNVTISVQFHGAFFVSGLSKLTDDTTFDYLACNNQIFGYSNHIDAVQNTCLVNPQYQLSQSWLVNDLPKFDYTNGMAVVSIIRLNSHEKMVLNISTNREAPSKLEVYRGYNEETDSYALSFKLDGSCK